MVEGRMRLTPPTQTIFYLSVFLALVALVFYFLGVFGVLVGTLTYAFWLAIAGWLAMTVGVTWKGV
jgi:hypothetical protein